MTDALAAWADRALGRQPDGIRYHAGYSSEPGVGWLAIDVVAVPTVGGLYRAADFFELPRPIWPPDVVNEALRRAGL